MLENVCALPYALNRKHEIWTGVSLNKYYKKKKYLKKKYIYICSYTVKTN